jgi:hypothetical protein
VTRHRPSGRDLGEIAEQQFAILSVGDAGGRGAGAVPPTIGLAAVAGHRMSTRECLEGVSQIEVAYAVLGAPVVR